MIRDRLQLQRLELKYIIRDEDALRVREFVRTYLEIDEYGATRANLSYSVHSLYLDSDRLTTYWNTINGNKNRYKLRLRFYEDRPDAPVYFEIKRRMNDAILKQRGAVKREHVEEVLSGQYPSLEWMASEEPKQLVAVQRFCELMLDIRATPKSHVAYEREAWLHPDNNSVRVTMDRNVRCEPEFQPRFVAAMTNPVHPFGEMVVLELKFTGRYPDWFRDMVHVFNLTQCSAAKYADGISWGGESAFSPMVYAGHDDARRRLMARKKSLDFITNR